MSKTQSPNPWRRPSDEMPEPFAHVEAWITIRDIGVRHVYFAFHTGQAWSSRDFCCFKCLAWRYVPDPDRPSWVRGPRKKKSIPE